MPTLIWVVCPAYITRLLVPSEKSRIDSLPQAHKVHKVQNVSIVYSKYLNVENFNDKGNAI